MARSSLTTIVNDLQDDAGSVLWSFVRGEQMEYPIILNFLSVVGIPNTYTFEAVVIEANNVSGSDSVPTIPRTGGVHTTLGVRVPLVRQNTVDPDPEIFGTWNATMAYDREDVVYYGGIYYKLKKDIGRINATTPNLDTLYWIPYVPNKVYIQFLAGLGSTIANPSWAVSPTVSSPVFGFFELRVTEPNDGVFQRTWKPVRGVVELLFSPTDIVADL